MDLIGKVQILAGAARYDASCASSGSQREAAGGGMGNTSMGGICHSWSDDGRCISLLKILFTNVCIYDCAYCANRCSHDIPRASLTVEEVVSLTMNFYRRNYIEGLFLSSGVLRSPDYTMECLVQVVERLRVEHSFHGYIHLKAIPGAAAGLIRRAGLLVDRLSVNIELPSQASLQRLAPDKSKAGILGPMSLIGQGITESRAERRTSRHAPRFSPAGQSTQMIIGATPETDLQILRLAENLYDRYRLKRVYYSAYMPVGKASLLPVLASPPLRREHRLYQADWLLRFYGFQSAELLDDANPLLDEGLDPKAAWALRHPQFFPVDLNRADYETILRVPGIGVRSAKKLVTARTFAAIRYEDLRKIGVVVKRARFFVTCPGVPANPPRGYDSPLVRRQLSVGDGGGCDVAASLYQPTLFDVG